MPFARLPRSRDGEGKVGWGQYANEVVRARVLRAVPPGRGEYKPHIRMGDHPCNELLVKVCRYMLRDFDAHNQVKLMRAPWWGSRVLIEWGVGSSP